MTRDQYRNIVIAQKRQRRPCTKIIHLLIIQDTIPGKIPVWNSAGVEAGKKHNTEFKRRATGTLRH